MMTVIMKRVTDPEATSLYQRYRDGNKIDGATGTTYTVTPSDAGKTITFEVVPVATQ